MVVADMTASGTAGRDVALAAIQELLDEVGAQDDWENDTLARYLEALHALLGSIENAYTNIGRSVPDNPWQVMADALLGARYYE